MEPFAIERNSLTFTLTHLAPLSVSTSDHLRTRQASQSTQSISFSLAVILPATYSRFSKPMTLPSRKRPLPWVCASSIHSATSNVPNMAPRRGPALGAAPYKLVAHLPNGRSVFSFCMCPGGQVVAASSEQGHLCVNEIASLNARDGRNANAALLVNVT